MFPPLRINVFAPGDAKQTKTLIFVSKFNQPENNFLCKYHFHNHNDNLYEDQKLYALLSFRDGLQETTFEVWLLTRGAMGNQLW